jgi:hypothetical protein
MALFKFDKDDIFINTLIAYPETSFYIVSGNVYLDNMPHQEQTNADVPDGYLSLYELNNDKIAGQKIYPELFKDWQRQNFKYYTEASLNAQYQYGDVITGSYDLSASISVDHFATSAARRKINSLRNSLDHQSLFSKHTAYNSSLGNKATQEIGLVSIPSIFYGERIKKGSVKLDYYLSGTLIGTLQDTGYNGELVQTGPAGSTGSGSVAGSILYKEGAVVLTGSWTLDSTSLAYYGGAGVSKWTQFGSGLHQDISGLITLPSASFNLAFQSETETNTLMMMAHARYGELNYSNNPTYKDYSHPNNGIALTSSYTFVESSVPPRNITHTELTDITPALKRETYISKVALYDEDKNIIGYAKVATPVRKTEDRQYTFKLKLDL